MDGLQRGAVPGQASLSELVEALEAMGDRRTVEGWSPVHTARRVALERAIASLVQSPAVPWVGSRIRCALDVGVELRDVVVRGVVRAVTRGGVLIELGTKRGGRDVTLYWDAPSGMRRSPVSGQIEGIEGPCVRVALPRGDETADRWTRRLLVDALHRRVEWRPSVRATLA